MPAAPGIIDLGKFRVAYEEERKRAAEGTDAYFLQQRALIRLNKDLVKIERAQDYTGEGRFPVSFLKFASSHRTPAISQPSQRLRRRPFGKRLGRPYNLVSFRIAVTSFLQPTNTNTSLSDP